MSCLAVVILLFLAATLLHSGGMLFLNLGARMVDAGFRLMRSVAVVAIILLLLTLSCRGC